MTLRLYEIPAEWQKILAALEEGCGEITSELDAQAQTLITASKEKLEAAGLAKRNLEIHAATATAQAKVFQEEAARCSAIATSFENAAERLGYLMSEPLKITGKIKTVAGTLYTQTRATWSFDLKPGTQFFELPDTLWRQADPELNKNELKKLAESGTLPEQILVAKVERTSVCLKVPTAKKDTEATSAITA